MLRVQTEVRFRGSGVSLAGTLAVPEASGSVAGAVLVGGSGPSTRDNSGFFVPIRRYLFAAGIAVLSYDKRGVGGSEGRWESATVDELAADASAALSCLGGRHDVDPDRISLFGHSEGGWVSLRASVTGPPPKLLVLNSCPGVSFITSEVFAQQVAGSSPTEAAQVRRLLTELADLAGAGAGLQAGQERISAAANEAGLARMIASGFELDELTWAQLRVWGNYDPAPDLQRCTVPTVALFGADDPLVPVPNSISAYEQTAALAGRHHTSRTFPKVGHRMAAPGADDVAPGYLDFLCRCVRSS